MPHTRPTSPGSLGADARQEGKERLGEGAVWHNPVCVLAET